MTIQFTRATSSVPGPAPSALSYYWPHASGQCHIIVWRPPVASFVGAPVFVVVKEGLGYNPGMRADTTANIPPGKKIDDVCNALRDRGWVIVSVDFPSCSQNNFDVSGGVPANKIKGSWGEIHPVALWPEQPAYVALVIQHIKTNFDSNTPIGPTLWGAGNSIDPNYIHVYGNSWGGTMALYALMQPTGYYKNWTPVGHDVMDPIVPRATHRVRTISATSPQIDISQFYIDTGVTMAVPYAGDLAQWQMRTESGRTWSGTPLWHRDKTPWKVLSENHVENRNMGLFIEFLGRGVDNQNGTSVWDINLSYLDWNPGTFANNVAGKKAWVDPHDGRFQGKPLADLLLGYGVAGSPIRQSTVRWGNSTDNPQTPIMSQANYLTRFLSFLRLYGYPQAEA